LESLGEEPEVHFSCHQLLKPLTIVNLFSGAGAKMAATLKQRAIHWCEAVSAAPSSE
jgi:hypothetical protein